MVSTERRRNIVGTAAEWRNRRNGGGSGTEGEWGWRLTATKWLQNGSEWRQRHRVLLTVSTPVAPPRFIHPLDSIEELN